MTRFLQSACSLSMIRAAFLSCGDTKRGLADWNFALLTIPILIKVAEAGAKQTTNPTIISFLWIVSFYWFIQTVATLISSLVIIKKIGRFNLLPFVIVSSNSCLIYKTIKLVNKMKTENVN